jgi:hypothetical protein
MPLTTDQQLQWLDLTMQVASGRATPLECVKLLQMQTDLMTIVTNDLLFREAKGAVTDAGNTTRK